jgi:hypothetical protein
MTRAGAGDPGTTRRTKEHTMARKTNEQKEQGEE